MRTTGFFAVAMMAFATQASAAEAPFRPVRVMVVDIDPVGPAAVIAGGTTQLIIDQLKARGVEVFSGKDVRDALNAQGYGCAKAAECVAAAGVRLGADRVVTAQMESRNGYVLTINLARTGTSVAPANVSEHMNKLDSLGKNVDSCLQQLAAWTPLTAEEDAAARKRAESKAAPPPAEPVADALPKPLPMPPPDPDPPRIIEPHRYRTAFIGTSIAAAAFLAIAIVDGSIAASEPNATSNAAGVQTGSTTSSLSRIGFIAGAVGAPGLYGISFAVVAGLLLKGNPHMFDLDPLPPPTTPVGAATFVAPAVTAVNISPAGMSIAGRF